MTSRADDFAQHLTQAKPRPKILSDATSDLPPEPLPITATQQLPSDATLPCVATSQQWLRWVLLFTTPFELFVKAFQRGFIAMVQCILVIHQNVMDIHQCVKPIQRWAKAARLWIKTMQNCMKIRLRPSENVATPQGGPALTSGY